jgi:hypothetical protein
MLRVTATAEDSVTLLNSAMLIRKFLPYVALELIYRYIP